MERIFQYPSNSSWSDRGLIPTVPTPQGWMLEQPVVLNKPFNASEQQFSTLEPLGLIATPPTPQGWMQQQPNAEIFIRGFNTSEQQFFSLTPVFPNILAVLILTEGDDVLSAVTIESPVTIPATARINGIGYDNRGSPVYWYIDTATGQSPIDSDGNPINPF